MVEVLTIFFGRLVFFLLSCTSVRLKCFPTPPLYFVDTAVTPFWNIPPPLNYSLLLQLRFWCHSNVDRGSNRSTRSSFSSWGGWHTSPTSWRCDAAQYILVQDLVFFGGPFPNHSDLRRILAGCSFCGTQLWCSSCGRCTARRSPFRVVDS